MKKILASIMAVFLVVAMSGCKDDTKKQSTNLEETKAVSDRNFYGWQRLNGVKQKTF